MEKIRIIILLIISLLAKILLLQVEGNYILQVEVTSYDNPTNRCEECGNPFSSQTCCDSRENVSICTGIARCDNIFSYCLRELGTSERREDLQNCSTTSTSITNSDGAEINFTQPMVLGLENPFNLTGLTSEWTGVQLYIEIQDQDDPNLFNSNLNTIDTFLIDIQAETSPGDYSPNRVYDGIYGWGMIGLRYQVLYVLSCSGQNTRCGRNGQCLDQGNNITACQCNAGFTGEFCEVPDYCFNIDCGVNGMCMNQGNSFMCVCQDGFTGESCEIMDYCFNIDCGANGMCMNQGNSFMCACQDGFTGESCVVMIESPELSYDSSWLPIAIGAGSVGVVVLLTMTACIITLVGCKLRKKKEERIYVNVEYLENNGTTGDTAMTFNSAYGMLKSPPSEPTSPGDNEDSNKNHPIYVEASTMIPNGASSVSKEDITDSRSNVEEANMTVNCAYGGGFLTGAREVSHYYDYVRNGSLPRCNNNDYKLV